MVEIIEILGNGRCYDSLGFVVVLYRAFIISMSDRDYKRGLSALQQTSKSRCCNCNGEHAKCLRCVCARAKKPCTSCHPSNHGHCQNKGSLSQLNCFVVAESQSKLQIDVQQLPSFQPSCQLSAISRSSLSDDLVIINNKSEDQVNVNNSSFQSPESITPRLSARDELKLPHQFTEDVKMRQAFGVPLTRNTGIDDDDTWCKRWKKIVSTRCSYYDLPGGAVGREFIDILTQEVSMLCRVRVRSERFIVFIGIMLQRDNMVKKGCDIRRLLRRRIQAWKTDMYDDLLFEFNRCSKQQPKSFHTTSNEQHILKVFSHLMLKGQVRAAVRWLTERADKGGVLDISTYTNDGPKTVLDVLKEKHPDPAQSSAEAFLSCSELSPLIDVDITGSHVEKVARQIQGSAGPGGSTASHWQDFLLRYGAHSAKLRDAVAELARHLANSIVEWSDIRALMSSRLIALDKCPGVRPIAIGEIPRRILCKVIAMATRDDVTDLCGVDQLCSGLKCGIEGSVHAMRELYEEKHSDGWGLLLVDARNAFN